MKTLGQVRPSVFAQRWQESERFHRDDPAALPIPAFINNRGKPAPQFALEQIGTQSGRRRKFRSSLRRNIPKIVHDDAFFRDQGGFGF